MSLIGNITNVLDSVWWNGDPIACKKERKKERKKEIENERKKERKMKEGKKLKKKEIKKNVSGLNKPFMSKW